MLLQLLFLKEEMGFQSRDVTKAGSDKAGTSSHLLLLLQPSCTAYLLQKRKEGISRVENKTQAQWAAGDTPDHRLAPFPEVEKTLLPSKKRSYTHNYLPAPPFNLPCSSESLKLNRAMPFLLLPSLYQLLNQVYYGGNFHKRNGKTPVTGVNSERVSYNEKDTLQQTEGS